MCPSAVIIMPRLNSSNTIIATGGLAAEAAALNTGGLAAEAAALNTKQASPKRAVDLMLS